MFSHVMIGSNDIARSKKFYDATLGVLGVPEGFEDKQPDKHRCFWRTDRGVFGVSIPIDGESATCANGSTIGFFCKTAEEVHAWHEAGLANGGTAIEDPPGLRAGPSGYYLAYLRDPDGNKICAMHRTK